MIARHASLPLTVLAVLALAACGDGARRIAGGPSCSVSASTAEVPVVPDSSPYDALFAGSGREFGVPVSVLRALAFVETRWQMVEGREELGLPAAFGVMALRGEFLRRGARLIGRSEDVVRHDPASNIRAAAALLRADADAAGIAAGDGLDAWEPVIARFSGIALPAGRESYVRAVAAAARPRTLALATSRGGPDSTCAAPRPPAPPTLVDQDGAIWRPSPNFNARMTGVGGVVHIVIVHSCEGSYTGCWSWLANSQSQVSAHYVIREDGREITQLVREASRAWHIGAVYDSTRNAGHAGPLHGIQSNHFTIGIEHAGYASQSVWPAEQIDASARLVCALSTRWNVPRDRLHIVSHAQLQPYDRTDPGKNWPWDDYLARVARYCGG